MDHWSSLRVCTLIKHLLSLEVSTWCTAMYVFPCRVSIMWYICGADLWSLLSCWLAPANRRHSCLRPADQSLWTSFKFKGRCWTKCIQRNPKPLTSHLYSQLMSYGCSMVRIRSLIALLSLFIWYIWEQCDQMCLISHEILGKVNTFG